MTPTECPLGGPRCPESICDCFIETHPDDPLGLHPEDFVVNGYRPPPIGWFDFGHHADHDPVPPLEFSADVGEDGLPLWERPTQISEENQ